MTESKKPKVTIDDSEETKEATELGDEQLEGVSGGVNIELAYLPTTDGVVFKRTVDGSGDPTKDISR